jgi:hypothetical protein
MKLVAAALLVTYCATQGLVEREEQNAISSAEDAAVETVTDTVSLRQPRENGMLIGQGV